MIIYKKSWRHFDSRLSQHTNTTARYPIQSDFQNPTNIDVDDDWLVYTSVKRNIYLDNAVRSDHPPRARPIFKFVLWLDTIKAVTSQFVPVIKCWEKKKDDEQGDIIKVVRGAALICFWPSSNPSEPRAAILYSFRRRRLQPVFYFFKFSLGGGVCQWCTCRRQLVERLHLIVVLTFKGLIDCSVHIS